MKKADRGEYGYFSFNRSSANSFGIQPTLKHQVVLVHLPNGTIRIKCKKDKCKFSDGPFENLRDAEKCAARHLEQQ